MQINSPWLPPRWAKKTEVLVSGVKVYILWVELYSYCTILNVVVIGLNEGCKGY